jgi:hypothetical protein
MPRGSFREGGGVTMSGTLTVMGLQLLDKRFVNSRNFGLGYWWVDGLEYAASEFANDRDLLEALVANPWYQHGYAAPRGDIPDPAGAGIHGPFRVEAITADIFVRMERDEARRQLDSWLAQNNATPEATNAFRSAIDALLPVGSRIYALPNLPESAQHDWSGVVGSDTGFLEYVAISPESKTLNLLVATDD